MAMEVEGLEVDGVVAVVNRTRTLDARTSLASSDHQQGWGVLPPSPTSCKKPAHICGAGFPLFFLSVLAHSAQEEGEWPKLCPPTCGREAKG